MIIVKLTSAVVTGRPNVYVNAAHIASFADHSGGCQIKVCGGNSVIVVETADTVAQRIAEARIAQGYPPPDDVRMQLGGTPA